MKISPSVCKVGFDNLTHCMAVSWRLQAGDTKFVRAELPRLTEANKLRSLVFLGISNNMFFSQGAFIICRHFALLKLHVPYAKIFQFVLPLLPLLCP